MIEYLESSWRFEADEVVADPGIVEGVMSNEFVMLAAPVPSN